MGRIAIPAILIVGIAALAAAYLLRDNTQSLAGLDQYMTGTMAVFQENDERSPAPGHAFTNAAGKRLQIQDFNGKILLVNFWATWCAPCVYELPALDRLQAQLGGDDFEVLAISIDLQGLERVRPYLEKLEIDHLQPLTDPANQLARALGATSLPTTILFDRNGRELGRIVGPAEWDNQEALDFMRHVINETK